MSAARTAPLGAAGTLLVWALFFGGATDDRRLFWIASAAVLAAGLLGAAGLAGAIPLPRPGRAGLAFLVSLLGLVLWTGASMGWSIVPDHSWGYLNRGLAYLGFAVVGLFVGGLVPRAPRVVALGFVALGGGVVLWALATKAIPSLAPHGEVDRLQSPIGFWNALALIAAAILPLALWLARRRPVESALLFYATSVALLLTLSRAGTLIAVVVVLVWLWLVRPRLEALATVVVAAPAAVVVAVLGAAGPDLDGGWFALVLLGGAAVAGGAAAYAVPRASARWERPIVGAIAVGLAGAAIGLGLSAGGPSGWWREFTSPEQLGQTSERFTSASSSNRWTWWNEAWEIFERHPGVGTGADSFEVARRPIRENPINVTEPHSTPLQFLSELGIVGFLLLAAVAVAAAAAIRAGIRRVDPDDRPPALALALLPFAYLLHALVDFDWDFVAVTGPALLVVGVFAGVASRPVRARLSLVAAASVAVLSLTAVYSIAAPWLAARRVYASGAVLEDDPAAAAAKARSAHRLNPLSPEPLWAWGLAEWLGGDEEAALRRFEAAAVLQPENWETWYRLGTFELTIGRYADACYALDLAYRHDPRGPAGRKGGELDQVKKRLPGCPGSLSAHP